MKKKLLARGHKKLKKSQRKLEKAFAKLSKAGKDGDNAPWLAALSAIAGAVTTALADRDKRARLGAIATEAKDKAVGLLTETRDANAREATVEDVDEEVEAVAEDELPKSRREEAPESHHHA